MEDVPAYGAVDPSAIPPEALEKVRLPAPNPTMPAANARICACGCGGVIPAYYPPGSKYLRGHKKKNGAPGSLAVVGPAGGSATYTGRLNRRPNWQRLGSKFDKVLQRYDVPKDTWVFANDEIKDLNDAWDELVQSSSEVEWMAGFLNAVSTLLFVIGIIAIFAPRIMVTWEAITKRGEKLGSGAGTVARRPDSAGMARNGSATGNSVGQVPAEVPSPWGGYGWRAETPAVAGEGPVAAGYDENHAPRSAADAS